MGCSHLRCRERSRRADRVDAGGIGETARVSGGPRQRPRQQAGAETQEPRAIRHRSSRRKASVTEQSRRADHIARHEDIDTKAEFDAFFWGSSSCSSPLVRPVASSGLICPLGSAFRRRRKSARRPPTSAVAYPSPPRVRVPAHPRRPDLVGTVDAQPRPHGSEEARLPVAAPCPGSCTAAPPATPAPHAQDGLLPLKQTVRYILEPLTTFLVRSPGGQG